MNDFPLCRAIPIITGLFILLSLVFVPGGWAETTRKDRNYPSVLFWPIAYHYQDAERSQTDVVWPIFRNERKGTYRRTALRPLIFNYERDPARTFRQINFIWPLTHFEYRDDRLREWIFPLYSRQRQGEESSLHVWPFYGRWHERDGTDGRAILYPFFQYYRNEKARAWAYEYFWPLGKTYREGDVSGSYFLPLWWRKSGPESSGGFVFPYFWQTSEANRQKALIPLWYSSRGAGREVDYLLLWYGSRHDDMRFRTLFPVYWEQRRLDTNRGFTLLAPVYWSSLSEENRFRLLFPFYFRHDDLEHDSRLRYYFPFYGDYRTGDHVRDRYYLFPLYVKINDPEQQRKAWYFLWPLVYSETTPETFESFAIPFYWLKREPDYELQMALGLYWSKRKPANRATVLFPFYLRTWNPEAESRHYLPFYSEISRANGYRKRFYLGPLAIRTEDPVEDRKQLDLLWPLVSKEEDGPKRHLRILPFYWHDRDPERVLSVGTLALLPPYYLRYEIGERKDFHIWPFYGHERKADYSEKSIAWPLFRRGTSPSGDRTAWQVLLGYGKKTPDRSYSGFFPLWHKDVTTRREKLISLLHWQEKRASGKKQLSLLHAGDPDWSIFTVRNAPGEKHHHLFPVYSYSVESSGQSRELWLLGPVYRYERKGDSVSSHHFLGKVLYSERTATKRESGFFWRLVRSRQDGDGRLFEINPFYYTEKDDDESFTAWLGGLYSVRVSGERTRRKLFWLFNW